jgi:hypothetical protein
MRRLGVYGENLPTKKERSVTPADFSIAGLYGSFNRKFNKPFRFRNTQEALAVLGEQTNPADYGWDALNGFFANLRGQSGSIIVCSYPGIGAAQAHEEVSHQGAPLMNFRAAYQGAPEYGKRANRIAFEIKNGSSFTTAILEADGNRIALESVTGIRRGDVVSLGVPSTLITHTILDKITTQAQIAVHTVQKLLLKTLKMDDVSRFEVGTVSINGTDYTVTAIDGVYLVLDDITGITAGDEVRRLISHTVVSVDGAVTLTMDSADGWAAGDELVINGAVHIIAGITGDQVTIDDTSGIAVGDTAEATISHTIQAVYDKAAEFDSLADWAVGYAITFPNAVHSITGIDGLLVTFDDMTAVAVGEPGSYTITPEAYQIQVDTAEDIYAGDTVLGQTVIEVDGVLLKVADFSGIFIGDTFTTGNPASRQYSKVTDVNESNAAIQIQDSFSSASLSGTLEVVAYQVKTYFRNDKGVVAEIDKDLGKRWLTLNADDADRYLPAVFKQSSYLDVEQIGDSPVGALADVPLTYLSGGTDGARPATIDQFRAVWRLMDTQPFRMVAAVETSRSDVQKSLEEYCFSREDNPIVIYTGEFGMSRKEQVLEAGQGFQRSNEVDAVFVHNWLGVSDPFASSPSAPRRFVPPAGHIMGQWIRAIGLYGIHCIPARKNLELAGASEAAGYPAASDFDRTDLADAGVNVIQNMPGRGLVVRNFFTPSTAPEFRFANAVIMRNFIKVSMVDALQESENTPNTIANVREDRMKGCQFMHKLWLRGSAGNAPEGETFGQYEKDDGNVSSEEDAYEIIADASNNSVSQLQAGERNMDIWFMFPAPAGSIKVGVGLMYKVN